MGKRPKEKGRRTLTESLSVFGIGSSKKKFFNWSDSSASGLRRGTRPRLRSFEPGCVGKWKIAEDKNAEFAKCRIGLRHILIVYRGYDPMDSPFCIYILHLHLHRQWHANRKFKCTCRCQPCIRLNISMHGRGQIYYGMGLRDTLLPRCTCASMRPDLLDRGANKVAKTLRIA